MSNGAINPVQFEAYVNKTIQLAVDEVTEKALEQLILYVTKEWYMQSPYRTADSGYERTYQFLDSLSKDRAREAMGSYVGYVFSDMNKISPQYQDGLFNAHMAVDGTVMTKYGIPLAELLVGIIEEGVDSPYKSHAGIGMFKATDKWLKGHITALLKSAFRKRGLNLVRGR